MLNKKFGSKIIKLWLLVLVCCFFCITSYVQAETKPIVVSYSQLLPPTHPVAKLTAEWGKEIEKKTNGAVTVRIFFGGTMLGPDKAYDGVVNGIVDAATFSPAFNVGKFPLSEIFEYPLGFTSAQQSTIVLNEFLVKFKPKEFDQVKILYAYCSTPFVLHTNKPVNRIEDLKGLKIRTTGTTARVVTAFGGTPVTVSIGDTYDGLSRGIIDSCITTIEALKGFKFAEVTKYTTSGTNANFTLLQIAYMNKTTWEKISKNDQKVIEEISKIYADKTAKLYDAMDAAIKAETIKNGRKFIALSAEENVKYAKAVAPLIESYIRDKKQKGLPADEVYKFCVERLKQVQ